MTPSDPNGIKAPGATMGGMGDTGLAWGREARVTDPEEYNYWDDDSTELVHILWAWRRSGRSLEGAGADDLARMIMDSEWHAATLAFAADPDLRQRAYARHEAKVREAGR